MAQGLKIGDQVKVLKEVTFKLDSAEFQSGLQNIQPGEIGKVVGGGPGRSVVVDFNGKEATISVQRLGLMQAKKGHPGRPKGKMKQTQATSDAAPKAAAKPHVATKNTDTKLTNLIANKVLLSGGIQPDTAPVVQISLDELPPDLAEQVKKLVKAKLELDAD